MNHLLFIYLPICRILRMALMHEAGSLGLFSASLFHS